MNEKLMNWLVALLSILTITYLVIVLIGTLGGVLYLLWEVAKL